jgi:integrase
MACHTGQESKVASIRSRRRADGTWAYTAEIRIHERKVVIYEEAKTFSRKSAAERWARARRVALEDPAALAQARAGTTGKLKLSVLIKWYRETFRKLAKWGRNKEESLKRLERDPLGDEDALTLDGPRLVEFIKNRRLQGAGPSTAGNDLVWIGVVLRAAKNVDRKPVRPEIVDEARETCRELRLIGKSRRRYRRPTDSELTALDGHFELRDKRSDIPMLDIWHFAITSTRREDEICRLLWEDNDPRTRTGLVRDAKHPEKKDGNHRRFRYTQEGWDIVRRQPRTDARIFPHKPRSVCAAFTRACQLLGIKNLHFHDGRHEAVSRLFEMGYHIEEVALFSLHESWDELKRYTNIRPERMRDITPPATYSSQPSVSNTTERSTPATIHSETMLPVTKIRGSTDRKRAA